MYLPVCALHEVRDERSGVVQTLYDGVHVAGVTQILQSSFGRGLLEKKRSHLHFCS